MIYIHPEKEENNPGKWIIWKGMDIPENHGRHKCPNCGEFALTWYDKPFVRERLTNFCPSCGLDMRVNPEEEKVLENKKNKEVYEQRKKIINDGRNAMAEFRCNYFDTYDLDKEDQKRVKLLLKKIDKLFLTAMEMNNEKHL